MTTWLGEGEIDCCDVLHYRQWTYCAECHHKALVHAEETAKRQLIAEIERLRAACFRVLVSCGADVDGARTWQEYGESRLADAAVRAAADLRDDYQDALKEIPGESKKETR